MTIWVRRQSLIIGLSKLYAMKCVLGHHGSRKKSGKEERNGIEAESEEKRIFFRDEKISTLEQQF